MFSFCLVPSFFAFLAGSVVEAGHEAHEPAVMVFGVAVVLVLGLLIVRGWRTAVIVADDVVVVRNQMSTRRRRIDRHCAVAYEQIRISRSPKHALVLWVDGLPVTVMATALMSIPVRSRLRQRLDGLAARTGCRIDDLRPWFPPGRPDPW